MNPTVSVIIPVYNASATLESVIEALLAQSYPADSTELIFVDNGSEDDTTTILKQYPVTLLSETSSKSPYAARNLGIQHATGQVIAFTDANKIPDKNWIEQGVGALQRPDADLAGGEIRFILDENSGIAEIYDSIIFNNNQMLVKNEKGAACGNLFVDKQVIKKVGLFPGKVRSGMDIWWTQKAVRSGWKLIYAENAVVRCIPRTFSDVIKKSYRVGVSHPLNMNSMGMSKASIFWTAIKTFSPPKLSDWREKLIRSGRSVSLVKMWNVAWFSKIAMAAGRLYGLAFMNFNPEAETYRPPVKKQEAER